MSHDPILVTGAAGFIGFHVSQRLLESGRRVVGVDNLNNYYDPALKQARCEKLKSHQQFQFIKLDLADRVATGALFAAHRFRYVIHLAAQPGVRYSLVNPHAYIDANVQGFTNVLEGCRQSETRHLIFASSSSVYGSNAKLPFSIRDNVDHPISLYAATKKANELMSHSYSHLFGLPTTGLRFFTVYGPWGRPDMAMYIFASAISSGQPIRLFNYGRMRRDFTYIDDVVEAVVRLIDCPPTPNPGWSANRQPRHQRGSLAYLQHRQSQPNRDNARGAASGGGTRTSCGHGTHTDPAGRCAGNIRRRRRPNAGHRIPSVDQH